MILDTTSKTLEVILASAKTTNDCEVTADYIDTQSGATFAPANTMTLSNGVTLVTVVAAPAASTQRKIQAFTFYNADTVNTTVTVRMFDGINRRRVIVATLAAGQSLIYTPEAGWSVTNLSASSFYSQGTWIPTDASGAGLTLTTIQAKYTQIGALVAVNFRFDFPTTANGSIIAIGGLPFTVGANDGSRNATPTLTTSGSVAPVCLASPGTNNLNFFNAGVSALANSSFSGLTIRGSATYMTF